MVVNNVLAYRVEPYGKIKCDMEVGTPGALLILGRITFPDDNLTTIGRVKSDRRIFTTLKRSKLFINFFCTIGTRYSCVDFNFSQSLGNFPYGLAIWERFTMQLLIPWRDTATSFPSMWRISIKFLLEVILIRIVIKRKAPVGVTSTYTLGE